MMPVKVFDCHLFTSSNKVYRVCFCKKEAVESQTQCHNLNEWLKQKNVTF